MKKLIFLFCIIFGCLQPLYATPQELVITIPKSGTNLLIKCIQLIKSHHGDLSPVGWHHSWKLNSTDTRTFGPNQQKIDFIKENNISVILILRDPRDLITAIARCQTQTDIECRISDILSFPGKHLSKITCDLPFFLKYTTFLQVYEDYLEWANFSFVYVTRYEDLVGEKGGGCNEAQLREIVNLSHHIGKPLSYSEASKVAEKLYGNTPTFKNGQINDWKNHFTNKQLVIFSQLNGQLLHRLNYDE